jgi:protein-S-isoprenylcysteine O-methyltransferase Ste14
MLPPAVRRKRTRLRRLYTLTLLLVGHPAEAGWIAGSVLLAAGAGLHGLASGYLTKGRALATAGPYRFVRNPFYVADFLRDLGLLLACHFAGEGAWRLVWLVPAVYFPVMYAGVIRNRVLKKEEPRLRKRFGSTYEAYTAQVPRFVPRLVPAPALTEGRFTLATWRRNREWQRTIPRLGLIAVTWIRWKIFDAWLVG